MLFLAVLGGAAVLEVHRALNGGNKDVREIKRQEAELRRQLLELQKELKKTKEQRELTEKEAAALSELNGQLQHDKDELEKQSSSLRAANEELFQTTSSLLERQAYLEECEESLKQENANLLQQFDRLRIKYEQESTSFHEQLSELKQQVSTALQQFTSGGISAESLIAYLSDMGVELHCRPEDLEGLPDQLHSAHSREERLQLLDRVELKVDDSWIHQLRLSSCPDRAARLLMSSRDAPLTARGSASGSGAAAALTYPHHQQQGKKLHTPPKAGDKASSHTAKLAGPKVPALKLAGSSASMAPAGNDTKENQPQALEAPAGPPSTASPTRQQALRPVQEAKTRSLLFLPTKKASASGAKGRPGLTTPRLAVGRQPGEGSTTTTTSPRAAAAGTAGTAGSAEPAASSRAVAAQGKAARRGGELGAGWGLQGLDDPLLGDSRALVSQ